MKDPTRGTGGTYGGMAITNANHGTSPGAVYTSSSNAWGDGLQYVSGGSTTNANGQTIDIPSSSVQSRELVVAVEPGTLSQAQRDVIDAITREAAKRHPPVTVILEEVP